MVGEFFHAVWGSTEWYKDNDHPEAAPHFFMKYRHPNFYQSSMSSPMHESSFITQIKSYSGKIANFLTLLSQILYSRKA